MASLLENAELMRSTNVVRFAPLNLDAFLQAVLPAPFADALEVAWRPGEALGGRGGCIEFMISCMHAHTYTCL